MSELIERARECMKWHADSYCENFGCHSVIAAYEEGKLAAQLSKPDATAYRPNRIELWHRKNIAAGPPAPPPLPGESSASDAGEGSLRDSLKEELEWLRGLLRLYLDRGPYGTNLPTTFRTRIEVIEAALVEGEKQ